MILLCGCQDGTLKQFNIGSQRLVKDYERSPSGSSVVHIDFVGKCQRIFFSVCKDGSIGFWNLRDGKKLKNSILFEEDGTGLRVRCLSMNSDL
jgi:WD40 repeat protein